MHKIIGKLNHMLIMLCLGRGIMHVYILFLLACPCSFVFYFKNMDYFRNRGPSIFSIRSPEHSLITLTSTVPWLFVFPWPSRETSLSSPHFDQPLGLGDTRGSWNPVVNTVRIMLLQTTPSPHFLQERVTSPESPWPVD